MFLLDKQLYTVFKYIVPNGKVYVGYTSINIDELDSLSNHGELYKSNKQGFYDDIKKYGWDNIKCEVVYKNVPREQLLDKKKGLCLKCKSYLSEYGYNRPVDAGITKASNNEKDNNKITTDRNYTVYAHFVPNGKVYIGQTNRRPEKRWKIDGSGYKHNKKLFQDILIYGWSNIKHIIFCNTLSKQQADYLEQYLIKRYQTTNKKYGYNIHYGGELRTTYYKKKEVASIISRLFFNSNMSMQSTFEYFLTPYKREQLLKIEQWVQNHTNFINDAISSIEFANNKHKSAYIFEIIKDHAV